MIRTFLAGLLARDCHIETLAPSITPSLAPTVASSNAPSYVPSNVPSYVPSNEPSIPPSIAPTQSPSMNPTSFPSDTVSPSAIPSGHIPSAAPTSPKFVKLKAPDGVAGDEFGWALDISGDLVLVGAHKRRTNGVHSGAAYLFQTDGTYLRMFISPEAQEREYFADKVAIEGNNILINAEGNPENGEKSGAVYHFLTDGTFVRKITASDGEANDNFGQDVAIYGDTFVISGDGDGDSSGSVYVYNADGTETAKISANDGATLDRFGKSFEIHENIILVGSYRDGDNGFQSGSSYLFNKDGEQLAKLVPEAGNPKERFGKSVAIEEEVLIVGADGRFACDNEEFILPYMTGTAYLYHTQNATLISKLYSPDGGLGCDVFGWGVALSEKFAFVGAPRTTTNFQTRSGAVFVFQFDGTFIERIQHPEPSPENNFGVAISIFDNLAAIGSFGDDGAEGTAYIYDFTELSDTF